MTDKTKHKGNPRRRLLVKLLIVVPILFAMIAGAWTMLQPTGAQIIFIAPDDNNIENVWIANINRPENPRQMTFFDETMLVIRIEVPDDGDKALLLLRDQSIVDLFSLWLLDPKNGKLDKLLTCGGAESWCGQWYLHPDGTKFAYLFRDRTSDTSPRELKYYDIGTGKQHTIYTFREDDPIPRSLWGGENEQIYIASMHINPASYHILMIQADSGTAVVLNSPYLCEFLSPDFTFCAGGVLDNGLPDLTVAYYPAGTTDFDLVPYDIDLETREDLRPEANEIVGFHGWHPDSRKFILSERIAIDTYPDIQTNLNVYNIEQKTVDTLASYLDGILFDEAHFNADGTRFVITRQATPLTSTHQIYIYDVTTGEAEILPLFGTDVHWLYGGQ